MNFTGASTMNPNWVLGRVWFRAGTQHTSHNVERRRLICRRNRKYVTCMSSKRPELKFSIDPPSDMEDDFVLEVPHIRDYLKARPSPFITTNNFGGGFVSNDDRVALSTLKFASGESAGADCFGIYESEEGDVSGLASPAKFTDDEGPDLCVPLPPWAYRAGARETIFMNPAETRVAIVTCGGLCPGLNDVVQGLVNKCQDYGVPEGNILGIQYGFKGVYDKNRRPVVLTKKNVEGIHLEGGTILGTSRGGADIK